MPQRLLRAEAYERLERWILEPSSPGNLRSDLFSKLARVRTPSLKVEAVLVERPERIVIYVLVPCTCDGWHASLSRVHELDEPN